MKKDILLFETSLTISGDVDNVVRGGEEVSTEVEGSGRTSREKVGIVVKIGLSG